MSCVGAQRGTGLAHRLRGMRLCGKLQFECRSFSDRVPETIDLLPVGVIRHEEGQAARRHGDGRAWRTIVARVSLTGTRCAESNKRQ